MNPDPIVHAPAAAPRRAAARILLAEDDAEMCQLLELALRRDGHEVVAFADGNELVQCVRQSLQSGTPVDLVVTDVRMPGITGFEAACWIRSLGCSSPVVAITAFADPALRAASAHLGVIAVLDKPFELDEFRLLVRNSLAAPAVRPSIF
jgi:CheY-like chemotaxis protein